MNVQYLKDNNLLEAHKHFQRLALNEISYTPLEEDDLNGDGVDDADMNGDGMPDTQPGAAPVPDANGDGMPDVATPVPTVPGDTNADGIVDDTNGDGMMDDMNGDGMMDTAPVGGDINGDGIMDDMTGDGNPANGDEELIDIDDLTDAQNKLNVKQNHLGRDFGKLDGRIEKLVGLIDKLQATIDSNNQEIDALKAEFEKRNPTDQEKLNNRYLDSYPFIEKPSEFFQKKAENGDYHSFIDDMAEKPKTYAITTDDVNNASPNEIAKSFADIDDDDIQDIAKIFNI